MIDFTRPSTHEVMCVARGLIADEKNWTKHSWARDAEGVTTSCSGETAYSFCALGAIRRAELLLTKTLNPELELSLEEFDNRLGLNYFRARARIAEVGGFFSSFPGGISEYNDWESRTHAEILQAFDNSIQKLYDIEMSHSYSIARN